MVKKELIIIIFLAIIATAAIGFAWYQYQTINNLTQGKEQLASQVATLENDKRVLNSQVNTLNQEKESLNNQLTELNSKIDNIESEIKGYLKAEGKITVGGKTCQDNFEYCLVELTKKLSGTSGIDCSPIVDGSCPLWCSAGSDADCCNAKTGYQWIEGRGCYDISKI